MRQTIFAAEQDVDGMTWITEGGDKTDNACDKHVPRYRKAKDRSSVALKRSFA
jgi:hypothetical protein